MNGIRQVILRQASSSDIPREWAELEKKSKALEREWIQKILAKVPGVAHISIYDQFYLRIDRDMDRDEQNYLNDLVGITGVNIGVGVAWHRKAYHQPGLAGSLFAEWRSDFLGLDKEYHNFQKQCGVALQKVVDPFGALAHTYKKIKPGGIPELEIVISMRNNRQEDHEKMDVISDLLQEEFNLKHPDKIERHYGYLKWFI